MRNSTGVASLRAEWRNITTIRTGRTYYTSFTANTQVRAPIPAGFWGISTIIRYIGSETTCLHFQNVSSTAKRFVCRASTRAEDFPNISQRTCSLSDKEGRAIDILFYRVTLVGKPVLHPVPEINDETRFISVETDLA